MKKLLLLGTAIAGVAFLSAPAAAAVKIDVGGFFRGYGVFADLDEAAGAAASLHSFEFRRDTEVQFNGETTLDNGLTVGAHTELKVGNGSTAVTTDEVYAYGSGGWGRVNLGAEDGAAYLLQVAAPSADSNVDGLRTNINGVEPVSSNLTGLSTALGASDTAVLDYQHADYRATDRLSYLTPKFNGFQAGVSYAPRQGLTSNTLAMSTDESGPGSLTRAAGAFTGAGVAGSFKDLWEVSARYDGEFQGFGVSVGGGYSDSENQYTPLTADYLGAGVAGSNSVFITDGLTTWNGGLSVAFSGFSVGGVYRVQETQASTRLLANGTTHVNGDVENETWVVGAAYDNGPWHVGGSYLQSEVTLDALDAVVALDDVAAAELETTKYTLGGGYTFGPGMTFRGAVAWGEFDGTGVGAANDNNFTQVTVGTDIQF